MGGSDLHSIQIVNKNIRSLRSNFDSLAAELSSFAKFPEIIIVTEIWISEDESSLYNLSDHELFLNTNKKQRFGGVAIYVSSKLLGTLQITIKVFKVSLTLLVVYRL